jgi:hypothetical protein
MKPDYDVYSNYNPKATREISVRDYLFRNLERLDEMLEFLNIQNMDLVEEFSVRMIDSLSRMVNDEDKTGFFAEYQEVLEGHNSLSEKEALGSLALRFMLEQLNLSVIEEGKARPLFVDAEKGDNIIPYTALTHLVDLVGREQGIDLWKEFVEFRAKKAPPRELESFKAMREGMARMNESGGFAFTVHDFDENIFVGRFDKCVVYDSLKDVDDQELAYYTTCYTGMTIGNRRDWCVRMRRTQTLFSADYCDELYWNREVYDEPEQPPLEFTKKMTID